MSIAVREHQPIAPDPERLLIIGPSDPAELVAATPVLEAAVADPRWRRVSLLVEPELDTLLDHGPCASHRAPRPRGTRGTWVRAADADACLLLNEDRSWIRIVRRAGVPVRAGIGAGIGRYDLTHALVPPRSEGRRVLTGRSELWRDVAGLLGVWPDHPRPRLHVSSGERSALATRLEEKGVSFEHGYVLCAPACDYGAAGLWPADRYAAALDRLVEARGLPGIVAVHEGDEDLAEEIVSSATHPVGALLYEEGFSTAKALVQGAAIVLTTDSFHRAAAGAFGTPCVYLAGPGPSQLGAVAGELGRVVAAFDLECAPCLRNRCPLGHHRCMLEVEPEAVAGAAERLLLRAGSPRTGSPPQASARFEEGAEASR